MATKNNKTKITKSQTKESNLKHWYTHGSGGHITVIIFIALLTLGFLIYASLNGILEQYYYLILLLVLALIVQVILFIRIRRRS
jgi:hypothetical protein